MCVIQFDKATYLLQKLKNSTHVNHILTNHPKNFHSSSVYEAGLSDFNKLTLTVFKFFHVNHKPKIIQYKEFNHFYNHLEQIFFRSYLFKMFRMENLRNLRNSKTFPRKRLIFMPQLRKNMLYLTNLPSIIKNSKTMTRKL